ncbi:MAG TPA: phosphatase PAP2 family protein [Nitrospirota bacterium]|nr:phosphatase PAP2 family protein [Nitrospirota bacterium]
MNVQSLDIDLLLLVNHGTANSFFDILMPALSQRGYLLVIPFVLAMFLKGVNLRNDKGKTFLAAAVSALVISCCALLFAELADYWIKQTFARVRPCQAIEGLRLIVLCPDSYSMPSGHAVSSFAVALPLFYRTREFIAVIWRLYPLLLASLISFSRIYLGVHYPSDVLAGALLGSVTGLALSFLYQLMGTEEIVKRDGG